MTEKEEIKPTEEKRSEFKSNDEKPKDRKIRKDKTKPLTKVIIRRLPLSMTEEEFLKQIDPIPEYDYFYFVPADYSLGENASSRAYINFIQQDDIFLFKDKFDGYVFVDTKGAEYPAVVEFAPFQGLPKIKSRKKDNKCGTIESDQHYISFLASLNADENETNKTEMKMEYSYQIKDDKKITSTPLLEYIASKKQARREERRKKIEEKKKQREDDKVRKQNQVVKGIPTVIQEEEDDGIIVRTIKSRPLDRDRSKKERVFEPKNKANDDKNRNYKEERDRKRTERDERRKAERDKREANRREERQKNREEYNAKRKEERERAKKERGEREGSSRDDCNKSKDNKNKEEDVRSTEKAANPKEEKVKKYSESRRDRFARNETKADGQMSNQDSSKPANKNLDKSNSVKIVHKSTDSLLNEQSKPEEILKPDEKAINETDEVNPAILAEAPPERQSSLDDGKRDSSSGDGDANAAAKDERKRIRNKDRPSLQIYQPGKRRLAANFSKRDDDKNQTAPNSPTEKTVPKSLQQPETTDSPKHDNTVKGEEKKPELTTELKSLSNVEKKSNESKQIEKKVTRYSERRNRARERRGSKTEKLDTSNAESDDLQKKTEMVTEEMKTATVTEDWNTMCSEDQKANLN